MTTYQTIKSSGNCEWRQAEENGQFRLIGQSQGKSLYGHKIESQAGGFDSMIMAGRFTIEEMAAAIMFKTETKQLNRVKNHIRHLQDAHGLEIKTDKKGRVFIANDIVSYENNKLVNANEAERSRQAIAGAVRHIAQTARLKKIDQRRKVNG